MCGGDGGGGRIARPDGKLVSQGGHFLVPQCCAMNWGDGVSRIELLSLDTGV